MGFVKREINLESLVWKNYFAFECLNVKIGFRSDNQNFIVRLKKKLSEILPIQWKEIPFNESQHNFSVVQEAKTGNNYELYRETELVLAKVAVDGVLDYLETQIRSIIAEYNLDFVFLHAGVVSWKGKGIIIPGKSFTGKTTLVSELIKRNCEYLSDEFAVIDKNGYVHPFPKKLSVRGIIDDYKQVDMPAADFGGRIAQTAVPADFMLLTEYKEKKRKSRIKIENMGEGVMAGVANSISVRQNPKFVLEVLSVVAERALILKSYRGEAGKFAEYLLNFLEELENSETSLAREKNFVVKV